MSPPGTWTPADVLMLSWEYPPNIVGGLAVHVAGLSRALARSGVAVTVLTPGGHGLPHPVLEDGVRVVRLGHNPFQHGTTLSAADAMNRAFLPLAARLVGPGTILHAHDWMTSKAACTLSTRHRLPLFATFHSTERGRSQRLSTAPRPDAAIEALEQRLFSRASCRLTPSAAMVWELAAAYGDKRVTVVPNGIDLPRSVTRTLRVADRILFVGRLVQEKGVRFLLEAFARVRAARPGAHLLIVGAGPEQAAMQRLARHSGHGDSIHFLGKLTPEAVAAQRAQAEVIVVPSLYEPFGLVALEALAWGVPLVASEVGGLEEFLRGAALLVPPGDPDALAASLLRLLADERLQLDLSRRGMERARHYTWDRCAELTADAYRGITAASGAVLATTPGER